MNPKDIKVAEKIIEEDSGGQTSEQIDGELNPSIIHATHIGNPDNPDKKDGYLITYVEEIEPLVRIKCADCHSPEGDESPYLDDYQRVKSLVSMGDRELVEKLHCPEDDGAHDFVIDDIKLIAAWAEGGYKF